MFERYCRITRRREQADQDGFTLIELLIVIAVLGILAAVTVFGLQGVGGQSLTAACQADAQSVVVAQEAYRAANSGAYAGGAIPSDVTAAGLVPTYLRTPPGNAKKYVITTDNRGEVLVAKAGLQPAPFPNPAADPCANL